MGIRRACSYRVRIRTTEPPDNYSDVLITIQQKKQNVISKGLADLDSDDTYIIMKLKQEETRQLESGIPTYLQFRGFIDEYNAPGSKCWPVEVLPTLDDRILGGD